MYLISPYSGAAVLCLALKVACKEGEVATPVLLPSPSPIVQLRRSTCDKLLVASDYIIIYIQILVRINVLYRDLAIHLGRIIRLWRQHLYRLHYFAVFKY